MGDNDQPFTTEITEIETTKPSPDLLALYAYLSFCDVFSCLKLETEMFFAIIVELFEDCHAYSDVIGEVDICLCTQECTVDPENVTCRQSRLGVTSQCPGMKQC